MKVHIFTTKSKQKDKSVERQKSRNFKRRKVLKGLFDHSCKQCSIYFITVAFLLC